MLDGSKQGGHWQDAASDWMTLHWPRVGSGRSAALEMHSSATINNADFDGGDAGARQTALEFIASPGVISLRG